MEPKQVLEQLQSQESSLRAELLDLERTFNNKKEQYIKLTGAIEALEMVGGSEEDDDED